MPGKQRETDKPHIVTRQLVADGTTVELEASVQRRQFGGANEKGEGQWAGAGIQVLPVAATVRRGDVEDRLEIPPAVDPAARLTAAFVLVPLLSLVVMAVVGRIYRRKRRVHNPVG